jgi:prepilin-type N-terminal cleavage/methylation domain-containing protein
MRRTTQIERGYSLAEALVVVAIIGIVSLVSVPNFMSMYRAQKIKTSIRLVSNDLRQARQHAVSTYRPTMVSFGTTADEKHMYFIYDWDPATSTWVERTANNYSPKYLEPETALANRTVYFSDIGYADTQPVGSLDGRPDIIFLVNGSVRNPPVTPTLKIKTDVNIPKKEYLVTVSPSGSVKVQ